MERCCSQLMLGWGFLHSSVGKEFTCKAGDSGLFPGLGRFPGEGISYPLQYSLASLVAQLVKILPAMQDTWVQSLYWENPLVKGEATHPVFWPGEFHGVANSQIRLSDFHFHFALLRWVVVINPSFQQLTSTKAKFSLTNVTCWL